MASKRQTRGAARGAKKKAARGPARRPARAARRPAASIQKAAPASAPELPRLPAGRAFPVEIDPRRVEATLQKIRDEVTHWAKKGRYTKVRFKFRGKQLLPDLPLAAVVAAEGLAFYWAGILRTMLVTVGANALIGVELVNDSEKRIATGKERLLAGDVDGALEMFREAADMDRDNPNAHLNIGIALKLKGDREGARRALEHAKSLAPDGPAGAEAERVLATIPGQAVVTAVVTAQKVQPGPAGQAPPV